jgi:hypothetical protein
MKNLSCFVVLLLLAGYELLYAFENEPDGFRGIKWGTRFNEKDTLFNFVEEDGGVKFFMKRKDTLLFGDIKVFSVRYGFYNNKFYMGQIFFKGDTIATEIKKNLFKEYGNGNEKQSVESGAKIFGWGGYSTMILYKYFDGQNEGRVAFSSTILLRERQMQR